MLPDGRVAYQLKKRWKDGTTSVVLEPQVLRAYSPTAQPQAVLWTPGSRLLAVAVSSSAVRRGRTVRVQVMR